MDSERWKQIEQIYHSVLAHPPEQRAAVLDESCQSDENLRQELDSLLNAREEADSFLSPGQLADHIAELASEPAAFAGSTLSHYEVLSEIGAGAMGVVYRARDTRLGRNIALKILPAEATDEPTRVIRFQREARAASALNHLNIVTIYDIGESDGIWYIAEELVDGITLRERLKTGKLPSADALNIAAQCAAALSAAHRAGIVHRDIKPENILIRPDGLVKVVDFGLAGIIETGQESLTQTGTFGTVMGTPRYMSPEQARGQKLDTRTDIFSLGAVLYEMVTGQAAFPGTSIADVFVGLLGETNRVAPTRLPGTPFDHVIQKALARDREKRYQTSEEFSRELTAAGACSLPNRLWSPATALGNRYARLMLILCLVAGISLLCYVYFTRSRPALAEQDTVLLADFRNQTGDPVFDPTLKQGLAVQLEQSPRINIFPDTRVREILRLMDRKADSPISPDIASEICLREGIKAVITGSIAPLGSHYVITLEAADGHSGQTLALTQVEAGSKERVLEALSQASGHLRRKLGESLSSVRKYDALLERTTSSIDALRAYSLGYRERRRGNSMAAIELFRRAVEFDSQFAYAYSDLATLYRNMRRPVLAGEYAEKAYALRDRVSERERLRITSAYDELVTGDIDENIEMLKLYEQIYPRDPLPHNNLSVAYSSIGQFELAIEESRIAMRLDPNSSARFSVLASELIHLNRYAEAKAICEQALRERRDGTAVHHALYRIAFDTGDTAAMAQYVNWFASRSDEYAAFARRAVGEAYLGQWSLSSKYSRMAIDGVAQDKATENDGLELGALYTSEAALRAAVLGRCAEARSEAAESLRIDHTPTSLPRVALALELCGESGDAQTRELSRRYPRNTILNSIWLPVLRAASLINLGDAASAVEVLQAAHRYEAAAEFWPQFLRGQAYLRLRKGSESAAEFRNILEHRGQSVDSVLYPLAHLGLAHAAMLQGDRAQALTSYKALLAEWKDADRDFPPLVAARNELARLE